MRIANVIIEQTAYSFDKPYGYLIPDELYDLAKPGCRVLVPFGMGNKSRQGVILNVTEAETGIKYKSISKLIDTEPILSEELLSMCEWMHETVFCTYFDAVNAALPLGIGFKISESYSLGETELDEKYKPLASAFQNNSTVTKEFLFELFDWLSDSDISKLLSSNQLVRCDDAVRKMNDATLKSARAIISREELDNIVLSDKQKSVAELIFDMGSVSIKEILYYTGVTASVVNTLAKKGVVEIFDKEVYRTPDYNAIKSNSASVTLTEEQSKAYAELSDSLSSDKPQVSLLYGVTGSGKTSVFLKLVEKAVEEGKGAIVMVPEISLTPQTIKRFAKHFGNKIAVFHSAMSLGQRMDEFKRVKSGEATVAIGTRSAIFAPVKNLSLIIIDEEQEHTYKSEKSPRFHARDLAKFRVNYNNGLLVLASATPSLETYSSAMSGKYGFCKLGERYGNAVLPDVKTVDMKKELTKGNSSALSCELNEAIYNALEDKKQAIVLLNRRGHNTYISCPSCGYIATCPNCSVSMTYHSANNRLMCHYCGFSQSAGKECPECKSGYLKFSGIGTQRVEEELKVTFPDARILRLDADSTVARGSFADNLDAFSKGDYDILLGTQMVAKGLDFPNVTVVGVLGADYAANSSDYRSFERSFSLLTQVLGRAGRGEAKGLAVIQTTDPDSSLISLAAKQDYESFYNQEIMTRKVTIYPPYCDIAVVGVTSESRDLAEKTINEIFENIKSNITDSFSDIKLIILGPSAASTPKINNKYRYRIIIKTKNNKRFRELLKKSVAVKLLKDTSLFIDINPETII